MRDRIGTVLILVALLIACEAWQPPTAPERGIQLAECPPDSMPPDSTPGGEVAPPVELLRWGARSLTVPTVTTGSYTAAAGKTIYIAMAIRSGSSGTAPSPVITDSRGLVFTQVAMSRASVNRRLHLFAATAHETATGTTTYDFGAGPFPSDVISTVLEGSPGVEFMGEPLDTSRITAYEGPTATQGAAMMGLFYVGQGTTVYPGAGYSLVSAWGNSNITLAIQWMEQPASPNAITWIQSGHVGGAVAVGL